jgi:hypothetical protein
MFLEIATTVGALFGAYLGTRIPTRYLSMIFGVMLLQAAWQAIRQMEEAGQALPGDALAKRLKLAGEYQTPQGIQKYDVHRVKTGFGLMFGAGLVSGLLGIGSGSLKVIAMDQAMRIPFKVSTATSNFMIGVTAAASASVYLSRGYVDPGIVMPVVLGILLGSMLGARLLPNLGVPLLRRLFALVVGVIAIEMIVEGFRGTI